MATDSTTTVARPYAKALFEHALETKTLAQWSTLLETLATISLNRDVRELTLSPGHSADEIASVFIDICGKQIDDQGRQFVRLLAEKKRLLVLDEIKAIYEHFKSEQERSVDVQVSSFEPLSDAQKEKLAASLKRRLQREVTLDVNIDKSLLGGAIIKAGDLVIDGSIRGKLHDLGTTLGDM